MGVVEGDPAEDFAPSRFGGPSFLPGVVAFGEAPGGVFAFGKPVPGFTKLLGVFRPAAGVGAPATGPCVPICGFEKGVGFGRSLGGGFCSATVFLSFSASSGLR